MEVTTPVLHCWDDKVLYIGYQPDREFREHQKVPVAVVLAGLKGEVVLQDLDSESEQVQSSCIFLHPGASWKDQFAGDISCSLMIDPLSPLRFQAASKILKEQDGFGTELKGQTDYLQLISDIFENRPDKELVEQQITTFFADEELAHTIDPRIIEISELLKENYIRRKSTAELADMVDLSEVHLVQLFKRQVGVSMSQYIFWRRFMAALLAVLSGKNVTEAALEAGFTDAAHFSRGFKAVIGISPSGYWERIQQLSKS